MFAWGREKDQISDVDWAWMWVRAWSGTEWSVNFHRREMKW